MGWEGLNRRKFPRAKFPCLVKVLQEGREGEALLTHTENISTGGIGVIIKKHLELFATLKVEIDFMDGEEHVVCRGKAVWIVRRKATEELKPSFYDVGIEFVDMQDADRVKLEKVVGHLTKNMHRAKV